MKTTFPVLFIAVLFFISCGKNNSQKESEDSVPVAAVVSTKTADVKDQSFADLFKVIELTELTDNVFKLVGEDYSVITAGSPDNYNSMVASWGGWGILFNKPVTWCFLRANRYTLEIIKGENTYSMSYFEEIHKDEYIKFGMSSGRGGDKMKNSLLTAIQTPSGNMTFKEARLIIECKLTQLTTVSPDDFMTEEGRNFVTDAYEEAKEYHKLVFGDITGVWVRK